MTKKTLFTLIFLQIGLLSSFSQNKPPKHEFRAVWVATVSNIDWPSKPGLTTMQQKEEVIRILDMHQANGMNTIILQVRPTADAFFPSDLEPWSRYLTGTPGKAPDPYYDPLQYWITECRKRGMELHAWLNPYRVSNNAAEPLAGNHIAFKHPEWILKYGDKLYFDPALPQTREFVTKVVSDLVRRYDIDAIHFDDYFYPYALRVDFPDTASFAKYNRGYPAEKKADWRRDNVDLIIKMLSDSIKAAKPWVKFGISPFGVWRNKADDPRGSDTKAGTSNYDGLYANILKWLEMGWIDYVVPQIYWQIGHPTAEYNTLVDWWSKNSFGKSCYIGQAPYRIDKNSNTKEWTQLDQVPRQIRKLREYPEVGGSAFFSSKSFSKDLLGFQDSLKNNYYRFPAIVPPMDWIDNQNPDPVRSLHRCGKTVRWKTIKKGTEMDKPVKFVVYMTEKGQTFDPEDASGIRGIVAGSKCRFKPSGEKKKTYEIRISVLDRLNNESQPSKPKNIKL